MALCNNEVITELKSRNQLSGTGISPMGAKQLLDGSPVSNQNDRKVLSQLIRVLSQGSRLQECTISKLQECTISKS